MNEFYYRSGGKTFACGRCAAKFRKFDDFASHKASVHAAQMDPPCQAGFGDPQPGPSDASSQRGDEQPDASGPTSPAQLEPFDIVQSGRKTFAKSAAVETTYKVVFNKYWKGLKIGDLLGDLGGMFDDILARARQDMGDDDLLRVIIRHEALDHAIVVPLQPAQQLNAAMILEKVEAVLQSAENLALDESFRGTYYI